MIDLGYEIVDFQYNTWQITNWRSLEKRTTGPEFEAGGWKWRILLFPSGNNNLDVVSIYLDFADLKGAPAGWHCCAQFALVLWNPEDPTFYVSHCAHHRFTAEESDWGFTRFYDLKKLFVPSDNHTRPLIENGTCNITAFVRIIKDPTGYLWHNCINYDSKKVTGYVGLIKWRTINDKNRGAMAMDFKNWGATSYLNVELQLLYSIKYFRKAIYQIPTKDDELIRSIPLAMQKVFYQLQESDRTIGTAELMKSFGWDSSDCCIAHDVQDFNRVLLDNLEDKMKNTNADGAISKLFAGKMKSYVRCVNINYESSRIEDYYDIQLNVKVCKTLNDSFLEYIREEKYGLQDAKKGVIFESFPPVLRIQLKRFEYDMQRDAIVKINDRLEYPMKINLQSFLSSDSDKSKPHNYLLHGVIVHSGDLHEGRYHVFLKPEKNGKWFNFNDEIVTPVIDKNVLEDNYGGEVPKYYKTSVNRYSSAYILVYIRESDIDFVLSPILDEDIPEHLQRRLNEEKALYEQKKKEVEERHLYLSFKIVTPATFGRHQGFDLANFDNQKYPISEVPQFKVLKSETYRTFKAMVAQKIGIPSEQIRLWVLARRQNKTVRPDTPIPDNFLDMTMEEIYTEMSLRKDNLNLFLEVADKLINDKVVPIIQ
ncbi:23929_t:CDS:10 [Racocetra persica]|uniref:23929_t:CDS:1 n=1 Tax=Racocetra persica TaxID=160502 RepID=A0ACA9KJ61_9GLOM|nr:23929_t:CDS:10 [Racocetra persica]